MSKVQCVVMGLLLFFTTATAQVRVEGRIVDRTTGAPIPFASVSIIGTSGGTSSNANGEFSLVIPPNASIKVSSVGYASAIVSRPEDMAFIELTPYAVELPEIVITGRSVNAQQVVRKAFASIRKNYTSESFLQRFFYRHYCKDNTVYGRLIEAFVDVWKHNGYRSFRRHGGHREGIRVTHLRRSLDHTQFASGHPPISISSILPADVVGYQAAEEGSVKNFYSLPLTLYADFNRYRFSYEGMTRYDNHQVYIIAYRSVPDSLPTTSGYIAAPAVSGTLYIAKDNFAFVKCEEEREISGNRFTSAVHYLPHGKHYFPHHLIRTSEMQLSDGSVHYVHIEMISTDIRFGDEYRFTGSEPGREELQNIPYDSSFWNQASILKATPLEEKIIRDLGGGNSLNRQFLNYKRHEWSTTRGETGAEEKLSWLVNNNRGKRTMVIALFPADAQRYILDIEKIKQLNKQLKGQALFVISVAEPEAEKWKETVSQLILFADGIINYRLMASSNLLRNWNVSTLPAWILIDLYGNVQVVDGGPDALRLMLTQPRP